MVVWAQTLFIFRATCENTALVQWIRCLPEGEHIIERVLYFPISHSNEHRLHFFQSTWIITNADLILGQRRTLQLGIKSTSTIVCESHMYRILCVQYVYIFVYSTYVVSVQYLRFSVQYIRWLCTVLMLLCTVHTFSVYSIYFFVFSTCVVCVQYLRCLCTVLTLSVYSTYVLHVQYLRYLCAVLTLFVCSTYVVSVQ